MYNTTYKVLHSRAYLLILVDWSFYCATCRYEMSQLIVLSYNIHVYNSENTSHIHPHIQGNQQQHNVCIIRIECKICTMTCSDKTQNFGGFRSARKLVEKILAADHTNNSSLFGLTTFGG